jgi:hypothetical protein
LTIFITLWGTLGLAGGRFVDVDSFNSFMTASLVLGAFAFFAEAGFLVAAFAAFANLRFDFGLAMIILLFAETFIDFAPHFILSDNQDRFFN